MDIAERLAKERRGRLAAERLLEQKQRELFAANEKLALHARSLSDQIVEQRQAVRSALSEAEVLKGQNSRFLTDLENAHTAAVMAERRLWDSINTIRDGFAVFDPAQRLVAANRAYLAAFDGLAVAPGLGYDSILRWAAEQAIVDTGGLPVDAWVDAMMARWDSDPIEPVVLKFSNNTWVRIVDRRARDGDMVTLAVDITEQMRIWAAIEAIPDGFVLFDRDDRLLACNQRYRDIYPESAPAMVPGARFEDILRYGLDHGQHADAVGREEAWLAERLAQHRQSDGVHEQQLRDGRWLRAHDHRTPDGGRVGLRVDISWAKQQQAALEAARQAAEAANRAKSAFLANMSHEIRTPMNGVVGMAELLCDTALSNEQRLFAETIRSSGEALLVIINDILDYSKIEAERLTLQPEPFDLERTIHEVAMLLQPRARAKGISLVIDFDLFLPTRYVGDPVRLRQVMTNLMGNAVKFTDAGQVLVRVVGLETQAGGQQLHVTVEDSGIGIAAEHLDHIFGEFNQVDAETDRRFEGTGLGLAITRRLVERMGGIVWVDSELGRGSCFGFRVELPVAETGGVPPAQIRLRRALVVDTQFINRTILERQLGTCVPQADILAAVLQKPVLRSDLYRRLQGLSGTAAPPEAKALPPPAEGRLMRVLAAEDNRTNQLVFRKMTKHLSIDLVFAGNGREALDLFQSWHPDLIMMDVSMPEMDGRDATKAIRALEAHLGGHVPIVALTAHAMEGDETGILASGMDRYLTKPLRKSAITDLIVAFCPPDARPAAAAVVLEAG